MESSVEDDLLANEPYDDDDGELTYEEQAALLDDHDDDDQGDGSGSSGNAPESSSRPPLSFDELDYEPDEDDMVSGDLDLDDRRFLEEDEEEEEEVTKRTYLHRSDEENVSPDGDGFKEKLSNIDSDVPTRSKVANEGDRSGPQNDLRSKLNYVPHNQVFRGRGRGRPDGPQNGRGPTGPYDGRGRGPQNGRNILKRAPGGPDRRGLFGPNPNDERQPQNYHQPQPRNMRGLMRHSQSQERGMHQNYQEHSLEQSQPRNMRQSQSHEREMSQNFPQRRHFPSQQMEMAQPTQPGPVPTSRLGNMFTQKNANFPPSGNFPPASQQHLQTGPRFDNNQRSRPNGPQGPAYEHNFQRPLGAAPAPAPPSIHNLDVTQPPPSLPSPQDANYPPKSDFVPLMTINNSSSQPSKPTDTNIFKIPDTTFSNAVGRSPQNVNFPATSSNVRSFSFPNPSATTIGGGLQPTVPSQVGEISSMGLSSSGAGRGMSSRFPEALKRKGTSAASSRVTSDVEDGAASSTGLSSSRASRGMAARYPAQMKRKGTSTASSRVTSDVDDEIQAYRPAKKRMMINAQQLKNALSSKAVRRAPGATAIVVELDEDIKTEIKPEIKDEPDIVEIPKEVKMEPEILVLEDDDEDVKPRIKAEPYFNSPHFENMRRTGLLKKERRQGRNRDRESALNIKQEVIDIDDPPPPPIDVVVIHSTGLTNHERFIQLPQQVLDHPIEEDAKDIHEPGDLGANAGLRMTSRQHDNYIELQAKPIPGPPPELMKGNINENRFQRALEKEKMNQESTLPHRDLRHKLSGRWNTSAPHRSSMDNGGLQCPRCVSLGGTCYKCIPLQNSQPDSFLNTSKSSGERSRSSSGSHNEAYPMEGIPSTSAAAGSSGAIVPPRSSSSSISGATVAPRSRSSSISSPPALPQSDAPSLRYVELRNISKDYEKSLYQSATNCGVSSFKIVGTTAYITFETAAGAQEFHKAWDGMDGIKGCLSCTTFQ